MCHARESLSQIARWPDLVAQAKDHGVDYPAVVARAQRGDLQALRIVFRVTPYTDGSGAESHSAVLRLLLEHLGDRRFSAALREERRDLRSRVIQAIDFDFVRSWQKFFPLTYVLGSHDTRLLRGGQSNQSMKLTAGSSVDLLLVTSTPNFAAMRSLTRRSLSPSR